jgi:hypothetical protein
MGLARMGFGQMDLEISDLDMELADATLVPDVRQCALLLDIDGTILDFAPSPRQVAVPAGLRGSTHSPAAPWRWSPGDRCMTSI